MMNWIKKLFSNKYATGGIVKRPPGYYPLVGEKCTPPERLLKTDHGAGGGAGYRTKTISDDPAASHTSKAQAGGTDIIVEINAPHTSGGLSPEQVENIKRKGMAMCAGILTKKQIEELKREWANAHNEPQKDSTPMNMATTTDIIRENNRIKLRKPTLNEVLKFLLGEGSLDGHSFGEDFHGRPKYWWRRYLREAIDNTSTPPQTEGQNHILEPNKMVTGAQKQALDDLNKYLEIASGHSCGQCPAPNDADLSAAIKAVAYIESALQSPAVPILEVMPVDAVLIIKRMAAQKLYEEMDEDMLDEDGEINGCWQEGYESMVRKSREALALLGGKEG